MRTKIDINKIRDKNIIIETANYRARIPFDNEEDFIEKLTNINISITRNYLIEAIDIHDERIFIPASKILTVFVKGDTNEITI